MNRRILVVDDEPDICELVKDILEDEGFEVDTVYNALDARTQFMARRPDLVLLDIWMPDEDGLSLLKDWQKPPPIEVPVVIMSGHGTVETAVEATRLGAHSFIEKPLTTAKLLQNVHAALKSKDLQPHAPRAPVGRSESARRLREEAQRLAKGDEHLAIIGESGVGKAMLAEYIHSLSARAAAPFVAVHASALDDATMERALADAAGGTLLVRQAHKLPTALRKALSEDYLAAQQVRLATTGPDEVSMRAVGVTQATLTVEPLRARVEDIPELVNECTDHWCQQRQLPYRRFSIAAQNRLLHYNWPGNLDELNVLVRGLLETGGKEISPEEAERQINDRAPRHAQPGEEIPLDWAMDKPLREAREMFERMYLTRQLELAGGNVSRLAAQVGMERTHLYRKLRSLGISLREDGNRP